MQVSRWLICAATGCVCAIMQAEFDELCASIRQQHTLDLEQVRRRNKEIWPQVQVARLAQAELGRVQVCGCAD